MTIPYPANSSAGSPPSGGPLALRRIVLPHWEALTAYLPHHRPEDTEAREVVARIIRAVRAGGDAAVRIRLGPG